MKSLSATVLNMASGWFRHALMCFGLLFGCLFGSLPANAQGTEYLIGVSDVLDVTVWRRQDLSGSFTVDSEGNLTLPLIGALRAQGTTASKLSDELSRRYSFIDPEISQVSVAVSKYNSQRVFVMGEVQTPGAYSFPKMPGLWEVIREAGGPTAEATLSRVRVIPAEGSGSPSVIDLENVISTGDFSQLPALKPGTTILIPRTETVGPEGDVVYVFGSVQTPGTYPIGAARTVMQAVLAAGGNVGTGDIRNIRVTRPGPVQARVFHVDLQDYTHEGVLFANMPLLPGDAVTVPVDRRSGAWRFAGEAANALSGFLGTVLFFTRLGDDTNDVNTTVVVDSPTPTPAPPAP